MTRRTIEFKTTSACPEPWKLATVKKYTDELLTPEFAPRQLRLREGLNWMRIVPALQGAPGDWMLGIHALSTPSGRFCHPRTSTSGALSVWDELYSHLHQTAADKLYSRANRDGLRLLPDPLSLCWVVVREGAEDDSPLALRLLILSGYSGNRGGLPGLGQQLLAMASERDENGDLMHRIAGAEDGVQVCIEKIVSKESKFARYALRSGRTPAPISGYLDRLAPGEVEILRPLDQVIRRMTEEEQWERLTRLMPQAEVDSLRHEIEAR